MEKQALDAVSLAQMSRNDEGVEGRKKGARTAQAGHLSRRVCLRRGGSRLRRVRTYKSAGAAEGGMIMRPAGV